MGGLPPTPPLGWQRGMCKYIHITKTPQFDNNVEIAIFPGLYIYGSLKGGRILYCGGVVYICLEGGVSG
jgi:hypothetical protein